MTSATGNIPPALQEIIEEFELAEGKEKLEILLEYSFELPDMPEEVKANQDGIAEVHECQSPVLLHGELRDGAMHYYFDIPQSAPTVRGFASLLLEGTEGATPEEILQIPSDFFIQMGLNNVLSSLRMRGLGAVLAHMKRFAVEAMEPPA